MSSVTQCDVCGNVVKHEQAKFLRLYTCNNLGNTTSPEYSKDLCPDCVTKLNKLLKVEGKK